MSYIRQGQLFPWEEFVEDKDDNTRFVLVVDALPDEKLLKWLRDRPMAPAGRCNQVVGEYVVS